jgi:hypothetical protein
VNAGLLYTPRSIEVSEGAGKRPAAVTGVDVEAVREEWLVEDRWWSGRPIARHYFELALADGRCVVVFRERERWFEQRA